jgi:hypothetical protein
VKREWCERALRDPVRLGKYLRVIILEDGQTVHNAFPDRNYREEQS